ncbi:MAG: alcohol dehydrogenase catalytic domain-containing protein [Acidimicrobiales bacterium]|nr:alcohol dehydrogenase catalytic domain-containing protein [Acidimicrobiales bacterium]
MVKAAVCREFGAPLCVEDIIVASPGPGQVKVAVDACAICHSDIHFIDGAWGGALPAIYGHEAAGTVSEVGDGVDTVAVGDRVVVSLIRSCGSCPGCAKGMPVTCTGRFSIDRTRPLTDANGDTLVHGLKTGTFAEEALVDQSQVVPVPADIPMTSAALLGCGVITGFGAVTNTARMEAGADVAVIGCGGVGLNAVQGAAIAGAAQVIAIDIAADKLDAAREFGATAGVSAAADDVAAQVRSLTDGAGVDYVFVTVGAKPAIEQAFSLLAPGGAVVLVGMTATGVMVEVDATDIAGNSQRVLGSKMGGGRLPIDIPLLVSLYQSGRLKLDELVSKTFPIEDINEAINEVKRGEARRNVIVFDRSAPGATP